MLQNFFHRLEPLCNEGADAVSNQEFQGNSQAPGYHYNQHQKDTCLVALCMKVEESGMEKMMELKIKVNFIYCQS